MNKFLLSFLVVSSISLSSYANNISISVLSKHHEPLPDMVVYLEPVEQIDLPLNQKRIEIGQQDKSFTPYISVVQKGADVSFVNYDDITHHIYSPIGENKFSFKLRAGSETTKSDFSESGEVVMGCNIHDWMSGYLLILDTPYFGKTDEDGKLVVSVPVAGQYQLTVWHPQMPTENNRVTKVIGIPANETQIITLAEEMEEITPQTSEEDFDFLSDY